MHVYTSYCRAAQYRYDVLQTLEEVQKQVITIEEEILMNDMKKRNQQLEVKDAKILKENEAVFKQQELESGQLGM